MDKTLTFIRHGIWLLSAPLLVVLTICYWRRFDAVTAATVYPPWCWTLLGVALASFGFTIQRRKLTAVLIAMWLIYLISFADSPISLLRPLLPAPSAQHEIVLHAISLNCAGNAAAAREAMELDPDVILFQESPTRDDLIALAAEFYGPGNHVHWGVDSSIVSRGEVSPVAIVGPYNDSFVHARVKLDDVTIDVISLRLFPHPIRMDLWSPWCWQVYRANREARRAQLQKIANYVESAHLSDSLIFGGDFNAPPADAVFRVLPATLSDSFQKSGRGWGGTIINEYPAVRIDQIRHSPKLRPLSVVASQTQFSDHRMVIADFAVESE